MKTKVLYIASIYLSEATAAVINIMEMCSALKNIGYEVILCVPKSSITKKALFDRYNVECPFTVLEEDLPKIFISSNIPGRSILFSFQVIKKIRNVNNSVIYSRDPWSFCFSSAFFKNKSIFEAHQFRFKNKLQTLIYHAVVKIGASTQKGSIVCISSRLKDQWENCGISSSKLFVAHDAVNTRKFSCAIPKVEARRRLGLNQCASIVAYTGSLLPGKGVDSLVRCANLLPDISFIIVGGDKEQISHLIQMARNRNIFFIGKVSPLEVPIYQSAADILALPNNVGGAIADVTSPMKLFEYMASERPIVATDMPSILEILKHGYNALISPAGDDVKIAENIRLLLSEPHLAKVLTKNCKKDLSKYTWDSRVKFISQLF